MEASSDCKPKVLGREIDNESRCFHWHSKLDIVAMRFKCCMEYYGCRQCHDEIANHDVILWDLINDQYVDVVMCGSCASTLTTHDYLQGHDKCPTCKAPWNPRCELHRHLYFNVNSSSEDIFTHSNA
jgi:uncharacterized CHY-type Zn-finger protein